MNSCIFLRHYYPRTALYENDVKLETAAGEYSCARLNNNSTAHRRVVVVDADAGGHADVVGLCGTTAVVEVSCTNSSTEPNQLPGTINNTHGTWYQVAIYVNIRIVWCAFYPLNDR